VANSKKMKNVQSDQNRPTMSDIQPNAIKPILDGPDTVSLQFYTQKLFVLEGSFRWYEAKCPFFQNLTQEMDLLIGQCIYNETNGQYRFSRVYLIIWYYLFGWPKQIEELKWAFFTKI
jgi:hypothetical protein